MLSPRTHQKLFFCYQICIYDMILFFFMIESACTHVRERRVSASVLWLCCDSVFGHVAIPFCQVSSLSVSCHGHVQHVLGSESWAATWLPASQSGILPTASQRWGLCHYFKWLYSIPFSIFQFMSIPNDGVDINVVVIQYVSYSLQLVAMPQLMYW